MERPLISCLAALAAGLSFAQTVPANKPYKVSADLKQVANRKAFLKQHPLTKQQKAALAKNLFFTCTSDDKALYWAYGRNEYHNLTSIVTADNVLQIYHIFFESTLRSVEQTVLVSEVEKLSEAMLKQSEKRLQSLKGTPLEQAAIKNAAFFGVACELIGAEAKLSGSAKTMMDKELALVNAHQGFATGAIFPYEVDYSQFIVRGHYTKTKELGRYFQAMMWFGLVPFSVEKLSNGQPVLAKEQVVQSLLVTRDLVESDAYARWKKIYDVTSVYAGEANNLTPTEWSVALKKVFGADPDEKQFANDAKQRAFLAELRSMRKPPIVNQHRSRSGAVAGALQFRFIGQRAIPDSVVLQELSEPDMRPFPSPLDVMSVLGSARATALLDGNPSKYNPKGWKEYQMLRIGLETKFKALPAATWSKDLYWSWLDCLRQNLKPAQAGYPSFMRNQAWQDKSLYSSLASWAELRHDTILYGMQSVAEMGDGDEPPKVLGYVEPNLPVYRRLTALVKQNRDALKSRGYLTERVGEQFDSFLETLAFFTDVSEVELRNGKLSRADHDRIRVIEGELESLHNSIQTVDAEYQVLSQDDLDIALVADVHTAFGQALEVGVGRADHLVAVVPIEGKLYLARGSALSFYEFKQPISNRMTDEAWKKRLNAKKAPPRPDWIKSFFVNQPLKGDKD